jgi:hypothetical protein
MQAPLVHRSFISAKLIHGKYSDKPPTLHPSIADPMVELLSAKAESAILEDILIIANIGSCRVLLQSYFLEKR